MLSWYKIAQAVAPVKQTGVTAGVGGDYRQPHVYKIIEEIETIVNYLKNKFISINLSIGQEIANNLGASGRINNIILSQLPAEYGQQNPEVVSLNSKLEELMKTLIGEMSNEIDADKLEKQILERLREADNRAYMLGAAFKKQTSRKANK